MASERDPIAWLREVVESATPVPWRTDQHESRATACISHGVWSERGDPDDDGSCEIIDRVLSPSPADDARAIAALRNVAPALLAVVEAYRREAAARSTEEVAVELDGAGCDPRSEGLFESAEAIEQHALARSETLAAETNLNAAIRAEMERQA